MGAVVGLTAYIQAKNQLSPELQRLIKSSRSAQKEMRHLDEATQEMVKEMQRSIKRAADQSERDFKREFDQMQQEAQQLKRQLGELGSTKANPKINVDDQARREVAAVKQEVKALDGSKATVQIEAAAGPGASEILAGGLLAGLATYGSAGFIDQLTSESGAIARRALLGNTPEELHEFQKESQNLAIMNPNVDRTQIKDLMTTATRFDSNNGAEITKQALQLNAIRPDLGGVEEYQMTMFAMQQAWKDITDVTRFGDTLAEIASTTTDIRGEALDSIVEYSTQVTKFLDTPEKLAALTKEMNNLWSIDKGFDALKEATIKLDNQGDMVNVLKTAYEAQDIDSNEAQKRAEKESKIIAEAIHSNNAADNQFAIAALIQTFGGIQDKKVRQELFNELGGGPGEDIAKAFAPLLQSAGRIGMADAREYDYSGKLNQEFKTYQENDPLRGFTEAKALLTTELVELGLALAEDLEPAIRWTADALKSLKEMIEGAPPWLTLAGLGTVVGVVTIALWKMKVALDAATAAAVQRKLARGAESGPDFPDLPDGPDKGGKPKGKGKGKGGWFNPFNWGSKGNKTSPSKFEEAKDFGFKNPLEEATKPSSWREKFKNFGGMLPKGDAVLDSLKGAWDVTKTTGTNLFRKVPETFKAIGGMLPSGDSMLKGLKIGWEGVKASSGSFARKIPIAGIGIGLGQILTADDPLKMAGQIGSEILGSAAGAAAGASVGSAVPGVGTTVGGIVGSIAGAFGGAAMYDKVLEWWNAAPATPPDFTSALSVIPKQATAPVPVGPPIPVVPAVGNAANKTKVVSVTIPQVTVPLQAEGVLQDIPTMLKMLSDPSVGQKIKDIIEKSLMDALETMGGVAGDPITR
ncbi:hypothetical protein [Brevibacillus sp. MER 51]|uniref:hypothetical protein n=1 Tax=Brevibacillus sp. MER 51 TaxID=2939560 RepID=UPI0020411CB0|nr:hypothetical protein [Brevibacillus sp. MER 51]MCM3144375.1 hypothetical protein [Brevibacillus sp. MER 51]